MRRSNFLATERDHNPTNLLELLYLGGFSCATNIITKTIDFIKSNLDSNLDVAEEFPKKKSIQRKNSRRKSLLYQSNLKIDYDEYKKWLALDYESNFNIQTALEGQVDYLQKSIEMANENKLGIKSKYKYLFEEIVKILIDQYNNKRGKDAFLCLFAMHIKLFNLARKNIMGLTRQRSLKSKEVIWALHCENKETLFDICFPKHLMLKPGTLSWENLRQYCVPLWYNEGMKLK